VSTPPRLERWRTLLAPAVAPILLAAIVLLALGLGKYAVSPGEVVRAVAGQLAGDGRAVPDAVSTVLWRIRLPRVVAGLLVGAALSAAGAAYQGMFRNPLVSPDILGVSAGAGLGALVGIFLQLPVALVQGLAFVGGLLAVAFVTALAGRVRRHDPVLVLVLAGVAVGTVLGAGMSLLKILADPYTQLPAMTYWLLGGLVSVTRADVAAAALGIITGVVPLVLLRWRMNLLSLPDEEVLALGVDPRRLRAVLIAAATLMTASAVSISGIIGWVGLVVPHAARLLVGPDFRRLLPAALMLGAGFLVGADTVARTAASIEIPLGILTALAGGPFFLWLLARSRRAW
jgi:iron complex transport system permease protein